MTGWRHTEDQVGDGIVCEAVVDVAGYICACFPPTPDPTSPCGHREGGPRDLPCGATADDGWHDRRTWEQDPGLWHPHVPTRCRCGHAIEADR